MRATPVVPAVAATTPQSAIARASAKTGVDFNYLLGQAQIESGMRTNARARTSSATGLYQFIDQSWLGVVKAHGAEHGLGWAADSIQQSGGRYSVGDPAMRRAILNLRNDPHAASLMAAEHASDNKGALEGTLGRAANGTDLYMAHFLGLGGAKRFLSAMQASPDRGAAAMFPAAARANRSIFYAADGSQRSLSDIYQRFAGKLDRGAQLAGGTAPASGTMLAAPAPTFPGVDVILGSEAQGGDSDWLETTMANLNVVRAAPRADAMARAEAGRSVYRPTPETARLAYLMLANLGA